MKKIQINLPDPLYFDLKDIAKTLDLSVAELLRRGAELIKIQRKHALNHNNKWEFPTRALNASTTDPVKLRELANEIL